MKVKVIKASRPSYWYADKVGQEFEVISYSEEPDYFGYKLVSDEQFGSYFDKDDVEIIKENIDMFDLKKERWFIRVDSAEQAVAVQEWAFQQDFGWNGAKTLREDFKSWEIPAAVGFGHFGFCSLGQAKPQYWIDNGHKEVKVSFKTIVDSVEYPETITPEQQQLAAVMEKLEQLKNEAEQLQAIINKGKV